MGKAEVGTPKYLANKMKAKGLQKLRWYCQMCQKQCRDENGFKCHTTSESHQRQLLLFADNPGKFMHSFSQEFADGFLELLRRRFNTKRVQANKVYQEYISDKNHLHMNATKWLTLSDFVKWLGRTSQCVVDETEKGWFITYIDRSPEVIEQQEKAAKKEKMDKDDQERLMEFISKQVERNKKDEEPSTSYSEFKRENEEEKIKLDIKLESKPKPTSMFVKPIDLNKSSKRKSDDSSSSSYKKYRSDDYSSRSSSKSERRLNALEEIMELEEKKKEMANRKDYWLTEGIVVKLVTKKLGDRYYKQKAVVLDVIDKYCAKLRLLDSGDKVKVDQNYVETVLPAIGKQVRVLNGAYRGCTATLEELHEDKFCTTIKISSGPLTGRVVNNVQYEDICKIHLD